MTAMWSNHFHTGPAPPLVIDPRLMTGFGDFDVNDATHENPSILAEMPQEYAAQVTDDSFVNTTVPTDPKTTMGSCNPFYQLFLSPRMQPELKKEKVVEVDQIAEKGYMTRRAADNLGLPLYPLPIPKQRWWFTKFGAFWVSRYVRVDVDGWPAPSQASVHFATQLNIALVEVPMHIDDGSIVFGAGAIMKLDCANFVSSTEPARRPRSSSRGRVSNMSTQTVGTGRKSISALFLGGRRANLSPEDGIPASRRGGTNRQRLGQQLKAARGGTAKPLVPTRARRHARRVTGSTDFRSQSDAFQFSYQSGSTAQTSAPPSVVSVPAEDLKGYGFAEHTFIRYPNEAPYQDSNEQENLG